MIHTFTLTSPFMERVLHFTPDQGLYTAQWTHRLTGTKFLAEDITKRHWLGEFSLVINDNPPLTSYSAGWELSEVQQDSHHLTLTLAREGLTVSIFYEVFEQYPVLRKGLTITNTRQTPVLLSHVIMEMGDFCAGSPADQKLYNYYGTLPAELFFTGRMNDPMLIQQNARTGEGFIALNEVAGIIKRTDTSWTWQGGVQIGYDTDLLPFERMLTAGESYTTAKTGMVFIQAEPPSLPEWVMPSYTSDILLKKGSAYQPPWLYNTWEHFFRNIDEKLLEELIPIAGAMGLDIFTIDDGWQARLGENDIRLSHFPKGLDYMRDLVEKNGMRLGLWVALAVVDFESPVYREHPDWQAIDRHGKPRQTFTMSGMQAVMCLATPYRYFVIQQIAELVERYHLSYIKADLTTVFNTYGESPGCFGAGHEHPTWAESLTRTYEAIQEITDALYARFPDLLIDLTFELWGQKHLIDYGLLARGDLDWLSNIHDLDSNGTRQARTLLYHRAKAIPVETMLIGNLQANIQPIAERFATTIGSAPLLLGDLRLLDKEQIAWYRQHIDWFKALRREIPLQESFFPLGNWQHPDSIHWDGFARLSRQGEGLIVLFQNDAPETEVTVKIPLLTEANYTLQARFSGKILANIPASDFQNGLTLSVGTGVEIWEVRQVK